MSSFDTLFRWKKRSESSERSEEILKKNTSQKSYKDIHKKRTPIIQIKPLKEFAHKKRVTPEERIIRIQEAIKYFGSSLRKRHIGIIVLVLFLSFVVYGVGFVLRTERTMRTIVTTPESYTTPKKIQETVYLLWQDYQVLGLIADNSPIPLEPLTSYGKILKNTRLLAAQSEDIKKMADDILGWKNVSETQSIFPILDKIWDIGEESQKDIDTLARSLFSIVTPDTKITEEYTRYKQYLDAFLRHKEIWYTLLGKNGPTRILILNQNNDELRAGGGFPGTVFVLEFDDGVITDISFHDIYELDHSLTEYVRPPEGINQLRSKLFPWKPVEFRIRDANYYPTFAESARKINELATASKLWPIDLVIGINTGLLSDIIDVTGPVKVPGIPMKLSKENIGLVLSMLVEAKEKIHGIPKSVISVLGDTLLDIIIERQKTMSLAKVLWKNLEHGEILFASPRPEVQTALDDLHLFDTWKTSETDFIYPIFTSISKNKSDRIMQRTLTLDTSNACIRTVTLNQKHGWDIPTESRIKKMAFDLSLADRLPVLLPIQGSGDNKQYIRFILPAGSTLESGGKTTLKTLETSDEQTILGGYITTRTGGSSSLTFTYRVPQHLCNTETQFFKQAGLKNLTVIHKQRGIITLQKNF